MFIINIDNFDVNKKNEINNSDGELRYWSQPDFSYKRRTHLYDSNDNEIGYIQYKVLSIQDRNDVYNKEDKPILFDGFVIKNRQSIWNYEIFKDDVLIAHIEENSGKVTIEILNEDFVDKCMLFVYSNFDLGE